MRGNTTAFAVNMLLFHTADKKQLWKGSTPPTPFPFFAIQPIFESRRSERKRVDSGGLGFCFFVVFFTKKKTLKFTFHI